MSSIFGSAFAAKPASPFGSVPAKPNLFGSLNTGAAASQPQQSSSIFGNPATSSPQTGGIFGTAQPQQQQSGSIFGNPAPAQPQQQGGGIFGNAQPQQQQSGGIFGSAAQSQPQQTGGIFGTVAQAQPQQQGGGIFGNLTQNTQGQQGSGIFGTSTQNTQAQQGGSIFGTSTQNTQGQQGGGIFGNNNAQQQQQQGGIFGASATQQSQQQQGSSLFGGTSQVNQQQQQQPQQQMGNSLNQSQQTRIWTEPELATRQKSVTDQIELVYAKWNPQSPNTLFQTYLYNNLENWAVFCRPEANEDEDKWEEALRNRPYPNAVPKLIKGFEALGQRMIILAQHFNILQHRLHDINAGLDNQLRNHDLKLSVRITECKRNHLRLSQKCLALATKTQVLRNRGYAMDGAEEQLRQKLMALEKLVFDPSLNGRGEEIWARMVSVRERGRQLQQAFERAGGKIRERTAQGIDEATMERAKKILEDYDSQLGHLAKELEQIRKEYSDWEASKPMANGNGRAR